MNAAVVAAAGIAALAVFSFLVEARNLIDAHARPRTQILNATRWAIVIALSWVLIPIAVAQPPQLRTSTVLGLAALIGALMLIPVRWFVRLGGRESSWELRRAKAEIAQLANRVRSKPGSVSTARLKGAIDRIRLLRTPETAELCDLIVAELEDLIAGAESWNEAGRRSIRVDALSRELWPGEIPPPDFDQDEATFRWHLYRTFGRMMEIGAAAPTRTSRTEFRRSIAALDKYRRPDTHELIDDVQRSASRWLNEPSTTGAPWIESFDFGVLGPHGADEVKRIWGRDAALWGAKLDEEDLRALEADLAGRAASSQPDAETTTVTAQDPTPEPTSEQSPASASEAG
jgi:hypothetical protein